MRHFNLLPEKEWEVDLNAVESLTDDNTVAMAIINPGNPCGNVYTEHGGAIPQILEKTKDDFCSKIVNMLREDADICYDRIKDIPCITCPSKPQGSMFVMVREKWKLN
ncbi:hypothetical protein KY289_031387 [Solanum tuberosum]|nr:hypothetical protein KY289_031387 [Solanum tuberosum]